VDGKSVGSNDPGAVRLDRATTIAFVLFVLIGGANGVAVRFSNFELPPFWGAALRLGAAALICWAILLARGAALPRGRALVGNLLYGFLGVGVFFALIYWGLVKVQASTASTILALGPLLTMLFAAAHGIERFRWRGLVGAFVALAGIALGVGGQLGRSAPILSLLAIVAAAACLAEAGVVLKLFPKTSPMATNAISTTTGAAILLAVSLLTGESRFLPSTLTTWTAFVYLVAAGSVLLFYLYLFVLGRWTASATAYAFLLFPVVGVSVAAWLAHETVTPLFLAGSAIALLGVWIGAFHQPASTSEKGSTAARQAAAVAPTALDPKPCETC
jgi:drug/metabolite transporter (DMT)-like permease